MNRVCFTAIIGNYEELKEPAVPSPGFDFICFTDQPLESKIWQIVKVKTGKDPQRTARRIKILFHEYIEAEQSIWIDAAFQINCDLNKFWNYFKSPLTAPEHPIRKCIYAEIRSCIANHRGDELQLQAQEAAYKTAGVQYLQNNIITSGVLMRNRSAIPLCNVWWGELCKYSVRDQVAFAKVCGTFDWYKFRWDYSQSRELHYIKHFKHRH